MKQSKISIIIPVYNVEHYLRCMNRDCREMSKKFLAFLMN